MKNIEITDSKEKMEQIGKSILFEKADKYNDAMLNKIKKSIDKFMPNASADEKMKRMYRTVYNYWVYGNDTDEDFYFDFDSKKHQEKSEYMTLRKKLIYLDHLNEKSMQYLFDDKFETYKMLKPYYLRDVIKINGPDDYDLFRQFVSKHKSFVVKPCALSFAIGVYRVDITDTSDIDRIFNEMVENGRKYQEDYWGKSKSVVVEELIPQHEELSKLHKESVNGIRVTTVRVGETVYIYHPWIKIGVSGEFIASAAQGGLDVGIDPENGLLCTQGYNENGESFDYHPTTGVHFIGYQIPQWNSLLKMAKEVAQKLPKNVNYIGWDFALTNNGWCIMEGNFRGDFMWQMFNQKGLLKEFEEMIGWKYDKEFWWQ